VIPEFMIQGGDPTGTGTGGPGYAFDDEFDPNLNFDRAGRLAMANSGPNTNGSQFFITELPFESGNQHYVIFGQCDDASVDVVKAIARVPRDSNDKPLTPVVLVKVTILDHPPSPAASLPMGSVLTVPPPPPPPGAASMPTPGAAPPPRTITISPGIANGLLEEHRYPIYPVDAKRAGVQGTVVLEAIIGKDGTIRNLNVVSGPDMLQQAAIDAVHSWRYRPYMLNGEPVEVRTKINVIFTLGR
jgi:TonB family protein